MSTVRTRFAPSPTGYMHIGGMRTALFNWLWARHCGGQFILRIDDTDQKRHVEAALEPIFSAFRWLGLDWDEGPDVGGPHGPYFQSQRSDLYSAAVEKLLAEGQAFKDYNTPEQNEQDRQQADAEGRPRLNVRRSLDLTDAERERYDAEGRSYVVRLIVPRDRKLKIVDAVRGEVEWDLSLTSDPAIARHDGSPLYNFACVVDDAAMRISHVIRAEEHLPNTCPQMLIYEALGHEPPTFAHIAFVTAPGSTKKLSKRDIGKYRNNPAFKKLFEAGDRVFSQLKLEGAGDDVLNPVMVQYYERIGYLPEALLNALGRLGWSYDDKTEVMSRSFLVENFTLDRVIKSPAGFDPDKLQSFQAHWMNQLSPDEKLDRCLRFLTKVIDLPSSLDQQSRVRYVKRIQLLGERLVLFSDILQFTECFVDDDQLEYDEAAFQQAMQKPHVLLNLTKLRDRLAYFSTVDPQTLRQGVVELVAHGAADARQKEQHKALKRLTEESLRHASSVESTLSRKDEAEEAIGEFLDEEQLRLKDIVHGLRVALTGKSTGIGIFDYFNVLGIRSVIARLDRAIARAAAVSPSEPEAFQGLPQAVQLKRRVGNVNEPLSMIEGELEFEDETGCYRGRGKVQLTWTPSMSLRFFLSNVPRFGFDLGECQVRDTSGSLNAAGFVTKIQHHMSKHSDIEGVISGACRFGDIERDAQDVTFCLTNFPDYRGNTIKGKVESSSGFTYAAWAGRLRLVSSTWEIVLDESWKVRDRQREAAEHGGFAVSHFGRVTRADGSPFSFAECDDLLQALSQFLSLVAGRWTAPLLIEARDAEDAQPWEDWTLRRADSWRRVESWFPVLDPEDISDLFAKFIEKWTDPYWRDLLCTGIYWYVQANTAAGAIDRGILCACIGLELVCNAIIESAVGTAGAGGEAEKFSEVIQQVLTTMGLPLSIPDSMEDLRAFGSSHESSYGAEALALIRQMYLHPTRANRERVMNNDQYPGRSADAWYLALWYLELGLLWLLGYEGRYANRIGQNRWRGQSAMVPWAATASDEA